MPDELDQVRASYGAVARAYAKHFGDELRHKPLDRALLDIIVSERPPASIVADVGCGPGHVTRHLHDRGVPALGVDVSPGMIEVAREANPGIDFVEGSLLQLPVADGGWGAVVALYSIIHLPRRSLEPALAEMARALCAGGLVLLSFHVGADVVHRDELLGIAVDLDFHLLRSAEVIAACERAGLSVQAQLERRAHQAIEAPTIRGYVIARKDAG